MALNIAGVADGIAALSVTGLVIKDLDGIRDAVDVRECPVLVPSMMNFITNFNPQRRSTGLNSAAAFDIEYDLTYNLYVEPVGSTRGLQDIFPEMIAKAFAVFDAALATENAGAVDVLPKAIQNPGNMNDPANNGFIGCQIVFHVMEFVN